jgi:nucleoside-diphosphate-sugar epimerase
MGRLSDAFEAISTAIDGGINALTACAKTPSVKGLVFTSSSIASTFAKPNVEVSVTEDSFNDEALKAVKENPDIKGLAIYAAVKTETEKYMWNWVNENKPDFVFNTVVCFFCLYWNKIQLTF